jgi:hypothetical protein
VAESAQQAFCSTAAPAGPQYQRTGSSWIPAWPPADDDVAAVAGAARPADLHLAGAQLPGSDAGTGVHRPVPSRDRRELPIGHG